LTNRSREKPTLLLFVRVYFKVGGGKIIAESDFNVPLVSLSM